MTYSTGGLIQATDFNNFTGNINSVWNTLYGQTAVSTVSVGNPVTAAQWSSLNSTVSNTAAHQGTTITVRANPTVGSSVAVLNNLGTDISSCITNQYNAVSQGTQYTGWTGTAYKTTGTGSGTSAWTITFTDVITFANATSASNFFNAGGTIKVQFSKTSTGTAVDAAWNNFVNNVCGDIYLSSTGASKTINGQAYTGITKIGGTGTPTVLASSTGFAQLTSTPATLYQQFDAGYSYSSNYVRIVGSVSGSVLTLVTTWYEAGGSTATNISGGTAGTGISLGTAPATIVTYFPPETTNISNTWGTPTVSSAVA